MDPVLIGLNGEAETGKDTAYGYIHELCQSVELTSKREAFADRLKYSASRALGVGDNDWGDEISFCNLLKKEGSTIQIRTTTPGSGPHTLIHELTGREYLQYYGTEAHREIFNPDFWVDAVLPTAIHNDGKCDWWDNFMIGDNVADACVITDVRFENEAKRIKELGGDVWRVERDGSGTGNDHVSEQALPGEYVDVVIDNNGTLEEFRDSIGYLTEMILSLNDPMVVTPL